MTQFDWRETALPGVVVATRAPIGDTRGFFERLYCRDAFADVFGVAGIAQMNRSMTRRRGSVRGLHRQTGAHAEIKVVTCLRGRVFDVAVDLRPDEPTFGRWVGIELDDENCRSIVIPKGFAHGFQSLCDDCELLYLHSEAYAPAAEAGVNAQDPDLAIAWPLPVTDMSERDRTLPPLRLMSKALP